MTTADEQRRVTFVDGVINGSKYGGVVKGDSQEIKSHVIVCHACGHLGGTLEKYATADNKDLYYHPTCAPHQLVAEKRARKITTGAN